MRKGRALQNLAIRMFFARPQLMKMYRVGCGDLVRDGSRLNMVCCRVQPIRAITARLHGVNRGGRTVEIQRLIGRSLRAAIDLKKLGERQIIVDCDVMQADGGTRTTSITGAWVALYQACQGLVDQGLLTENPVTDCMAAVPCGIVDGTCRLDLEYTEDSAAQADANFVLTETGGIIEVQASAEDTPFTADKMAELMRLASKGIGEICALQKSVLGL